MRSISIVIFALLALCSFAEMSLADLNAPVFVKVDKLNVRDAPGNLVIDTLRLGQLVVIEERQNEWVRIRNSGVSEHWVAAEHLCSGNGCWVQHISRGVTPARRSYSGGSCPCSGYENCYGPRGGRYCITSGGNKRYR